MYLLGKQHRGLIEFSTPVITYSIVQGGYPGTGNLDTDPLFVDQPDHTQAPTTAGNLRLQPCSPAIDAGNDAANNTANDLDGNIRKRDIYSSGPQIDLGAYEAVTGDNEVPMITCPAVQTLALGPNCSATLPDYTGLASVSDNCEVSITQSPDPGTNYSGSAEHNSRPDRAG